MIDKDEADARWQIADCLYRYARGIDRHDPELTLSAYHEGAHDDHGYFVGDARDFALRAPEAHQAWASHQHYILNHLIEFDRERADRASVETYWIMTGRRRADDGVDMSGGRYVDRFERRGARWAIAQRVCIVEWTSDPARMADIARVFVAGRQDRGDPSYSAASWAPRPPRDDRSFAAAAGGSTER